MSTSRRAALLVSVAGLCWATNPILIKYADWDPVGSAWVRAFVSVVLISTWLIWQKKLSFEDLRRQSFSALCLAVSSATWCIGCFYTSVANITILCYTFPFMSLLIEMSLGFYPKRRETFLLLIGSGGAFCIFWDELGHGSFVGNMLGLTSALSYALHLISASKLDSDEEVMSTALLGNIFMVVCLGGFIGDGAKGTLAFTPLLLLALSGVTGALAFLLIAKATRHIPPHITGTILLVEIPITCGLAWWWLNESISSWLKALGMALVLCGAIGIQLWKAPKKLESKPKP